MSEDDDFLQEIRKDYLDEVTFLLEECEESFLNLEKNAANAEELSKLFRMAHSVKGGAAAIGFTDLASFAHKVEDCLSLLRDTPDLVDATIVSLLLESGDALKARIGHFKKGSSENWDVGHLESSLIAWLQSKHAMSASAASFALPDGLPIDALPGDPEVQLGAAKKDHSVKKSEILKVDSDKIDQFIDTLGEIVVLKSQLENQCEQYVGDLRLATLLRLLDRNVRQLQDEALSLRMTDFKNLSLKMQRTVRDLSLKLDKRIDFEFSGAETELDRSLIETLSDPIMHIVRNSLDHGIEHEADRMLDGKNPVGKIQMIFKQHGPKVHIEIIDDGKGMQPAKILKKAIEKGLISAEAGQSLSDTEILQFVFAPGFSTAEKITDVSGRGVGMDVVMTNIKKIQGEVRLSSEFGQGTRILIQVPLTTAITDGLVVTNRGQTFIIPVSCIRELAPWSDDSRQLLDARSGHSVAFYREKSIPYVDLHKILSTPNTAAASTAFRGLQITVDSKNGLYAFRVDEVVGQSQVVLKTLDAKFLHVDGVSGGAVLGDGTVGLILDPESLWKMAS